jgi:hypothetical protein
MIFFAIAASFSVNTQTLTPPQGVLSKPLGLQTLIDEAELIRVTNAIDVAVDSKNWTKARSYFAGTVRADFSSLTGQPAAGITADSRIKDWSEKSRTEKNQPASAHKSHRHREGRRHYGLFPRLCLELHGRQ